MPALSRPVARAAPARLYRNKARKNKGGDGGSRAPRTFQCKKGMHIRGKAGESDVSLRRKNGGRRRRPQRIESKLQSASPPPACAPPRFYLFLSLPLYPSPLSAAPFSLLFRKRQPLIYTGFCIPQHGSRGAFAFTFRLSLARAARPMREQYTLRRRPISFVGRIHSPRAPRGQRRGRERRHSSSREPRSAR